MAIGVEPNAGRVADTELPAATVIPADNAEALSGLTVPVVRALLAVRDLNGAINTGLLGAAKLALDAQAFTANEWLLTQAVLKATTDGTTVTNLRTPSTFKTVTATASGNTALWTPTSGKKFRLMGLLVELTADATLAAAATFHITLQDTAAAMNLGWSARVGTTGATTTTTANIIEAGWSDFGNGFLSAAANNVLNLNLSAALTAGVVRATAFGTEE
jgi:hypothetical protein